MSKIGYIYKIFCKTDNELVYYGSTTQNRVCNRISGHNRSYKSWKLGKSSFVTSFSVIDTGDWDYMTVEKVMHDEPFELRNRERYWIKNNECVNKCIPNNTPKESDKKYREQNKEKIAEYKKQNKEKIAENKKDYYEENKEKIAEKTKDYRKQNKEKIAEYKKDHYEENKEKIAEYYKQNKEKIAEYYKQNKEKIAEYKKKKVTCECGCIVRYDVLQRHKKTKKHLDKIKDK